MIGDPRKLRGAAALTEIVERLKTFGAEVEKALQGLWYLETGEVVPDVVLETLGIK